MNTIATIRGADDAPDSIRDLARGETAPTPLTPRDLRVEVRYIDPETGEKKVAEVTSRVPSASGRTKAARIVASLAGGATWGSLTPVDQARFVALAQVAVQVSDLPEWLDRALGENDALLWQFASVLRGHEQRYFRGGDGEGETHEGEPRMVVRPLDPS